MQKKKKLLLMGVAGLLIVLGLGLYKAYDYFYVPRYLKPLAYVGKEIPRIKIVSYGQETYLAWREREVRRRLVVVLDNHLDLKKIDSGRLSLLKKARSQKETEKLVAKGLKSDQNDVVTAENWLFASQRDGTISHVYWVVPDPLWENVEKQLPKYPSLKKEGNLITGEVSGKALTMSKLDDLPSFQEPVLIFVGLDYFLVSPRVLSSKERAKWDLPKKLPQEEEKPVPWTFPKDVFDKLAAKNIETDLVVTSLSYENRLVPDWYRGLIEEMVGRLRKELKR